MIQIKTVQSKKDKKVFVDLPWLLYEGDKNWVPPLKMAVNVLLNKMKHPFYMTSETELWIAYKNEVPVGRIMAVHNRAWNEFHEDKKGFFGFFESINDQEVASKLFEAARNWLKARGLNEMEGPVNPSTNYECGTLIEGFDDPPQIMMTYNQPYHDQLIQKSGLKKAKDLFAWRLPLENRLPEVMYKIADRAIGRNKITFRNLNKKDWANEVARMHDVYNSAWEKNWGFVPMSKEEFFHTAKDLKSIVDEELVQFIEINGETAGFIVTLPDLNQALIKNPSGKLLPAIFKILNKRKHVNRMRTITLGMKEKFRKGGFETILYVKSFEAGMKIGYKEVEMSWILEDNTPMNKPIERMGSTLYKKYRIYNQNL
ncbi:MAG: GNAT family N-acetyltransferase [Bdellovibrio sp.]